eukprot:UN03236
MITSSLIALSLSLEPVDPHILDFPPETANFLSKEVLFDTAVYGISVSALSFISYICMLFVFNDNPLPLSTNCNTHSGFATCTTVWHARSVVYAVMTCCLLFHGFVCRHARRSLFQMNFFGNKVMVVFVILGTALLIPSYYIPWVANNLFKTAPPNAWVMGLFVAVCVVIHLVISEIL